MTRREFLKLSSTGALSLFLIPYFPQPESLNPQQFAESEFPTGRVLENRVTLYDSPSFSGNFIKMFYRDVLLPISDITIGDENPSYNRVWYELDPLLCAFRQVQPVKLTDLSAAFPGNGQSPKSPSLTPTPLEPKISKIRCLSVLLRSPLDHRLKQDEMESSVYHSDDQFNSVICRRPTHSANHRRRTQPARRIYPGEKRIEILLNDQVGIAYESDIPVFMTRSQPARFSTVISAPVASTSPTANAHRATWPTRIGRPKSYDLPGVPGSVSHPQWNFVQGTYWHNDFGKPEHGCINLSTPPVDLSLDNPDCFG